MRERSTAFQFVRIHPDGSNVPMTAHLEFSGYPQIQSFRLPILRAGDYDTRRAIGVVTEIVGSTEAGRELRRNLQAGNF